MFLTAEWRWLALLNYEADPALLRPHVPAGTELDAWNGVTYVSMVGFLFLGTRVLGCRVPLHQDFEEVNLRFYVRRRGPEGWRRGVVFLKEIVPRPLVAAAARLVYNEKYVAMPMRSRVTLGGEEGGGGEIEYGWRHAGRWCGLRARVAGSPRPLLLGSEEEFITEHYWGYTAQRGGGTLEYRVEHPRWSVWPARESALECDLAALYGPELAEVLGVRPHSAFVADGSAVTVRRGVRI
ncbi:MAG TPA: DUF2071 domain-containing protein [Longimicrobiaceae bacterium]|nr:DUF2071 domain-containing protein [Longimicrobiaceae bacterium]